jgi:LAGLIDADG-like domain
MAQYRVVNPLASADAAYIAGLIDGEGTITLSRKHAGEKRQLAISISNTERPLLDFVLQSVGAGKVTRKKTTKPHHAPGLTYALWNRQALSLLVQVKPFLRSYKRMRAQLVLDHYVQLTPRNGKYTPEIAAERQRFESKLLGLRAHTAAEKIAAAA